MKKLLPLLFALCLPGLVTPLPALLSTPDNILYGSIALSGQPVNSASNHVVVEARRAPAGAVIASYRMGDDPRLTNYYVLRMPLEEFPAGAPAHASLLGDTVYLVVKIGDVEGPTIPFTFARRGVAQRVDFGVSATDADADTLPDAWETANFGSTLVGPGTVCTNGQTALKNFIDGCNPNNSNSLFRLKVTLTNGQSSVYFFGRKAEGSGYAGLARYYALETRTNAAAGAWIGVPGMTNLLGDNQTIQHTAPGTNLPGFYRGRVWLQGP